MTKRLRAKNRQGGAYLKRHEADFRALAQAALPTAGAFTPTIHQQVAIAALRLHPEAAHNRTLLAHYSGVGRRTISGWFALPGFAQWWGRHCMELAEAMMGPAALEMQAIVADPANSPTQRSKAIEALFRIVGRTKGGVGEAVAALLERAGKGVPTRIRAIEGVGVSAIEIEQNNPPSSSGDSPVLHNERYQKVEPGLPQCTVNVPTDAVTMSADDNHALGAEHQAHGVVVGAEQEREWERGRAALEARDDGLPYPSPSDEDVCPGLFALLGGVGANNKPIEGQQQHGKGTVPPNLQEPETAILPESADSAPLDPFAQSRVYTPARDDDPSRLATDAGSEPPAA